MGADCCKNACAPIAIALLPEAQAPSCEEQYLILETLHQVDAMFDALSSVVRRTFLLSQLDGLTYDAIALHSASRYSEPRKVTGYGGVIFDLTPHWSAYASYAEIYKPQALYRSVPMPGDSLKPVTGKSHERGVKGELANGAVNATFSVFHVERNGEAVSDPAYPPNTQLYSGRCCYLPKGKVTSRGVDMEVGGEVLPEWQLAAGYAYNNTRDESSGLPYSSITPRHLFKLSTAYALPGAWSQWSVGGNPACAARSMSAAKCMRLPATPRRSTSSRAVMPCWARCCNTG